MKVKRGWATDFGKVRFDVEVDETDLLRMLAERGCADPEGVAARMDPYVVFRVMDEEALAYVSASLRKQEPNNEEQHRRAASFHRTERDKLLTRVLHPEKPAASE